MVTCPCPELSWSLLVNGSLPYYSWVSCWCWSSLAADVDVWGVPWPRPVHAVVGLPSSWLDNPADFGDGQAIVLHSGSGLSADGKLWKKMDIEIQSNSNKFYSIYMFPDVYIMWADPLLLWQFTVLERLSVLLCVTIKREWQDALFD